MKVKQCNVQDVDGGSASHVLKLNAAMHGDQSPNSNDESVLPPT